MSSAKKNILLIGGAGYLGSRLRNTLSSHTVFYTSRTKKENALELDLLKKETFSNLKDQRYDLIILLASSLKGLGTTELKKEYLDTDTKGLPDLLQYISDHQLTNKLIYISSMTVYGMENEIPVKENAALAPVSTYGLSKMLAEKIFGFYCSANPVNGAILRVPGIYGGQRTSGSIYNTIMKCIKNSAIEIDTTGLGYWETIHIDDLCKGISDFIEHYDWKAKTGIYNIGYGIKTDIIECAYLIKELTGSSSGITVKNGKGYVDLYLDNSKIKQFIPMENNYRAGLEKYIKEIRL